MHNLKNIMNINYSKHYNGYKANIIKKNSDIKEINNNFNNFKNIIQPANSNNLKLLKIQLKNKRPNSVVKTKKILNYEIKENNNKYNNEKENQLNNSFISYLKTQNEELNNKI